jgi:hypothetical protein
MAKKRTTIMKLDQFSENPHFFLKTTKVKQPIPRARHKAKAITRYHN